MTKLLSIFIALSVVTQALADDPGKQEIGSLRVEVIYAADQEGFEEIGRVISDEQARFVREINGLKFENYRSLGVENLGILRSYESWATPLRPSKEMLVSFEPIKREGKDRIQIALEYWQAKRKLFQTNPILVKGKAFHLLGPEWRGGRLILKVELTELSDK